MLHAMVRICQILDIDIGDHLNVGRTSCTVKKVGMWFAIWKQIVKQRDHHEMTKCRTASTFSFFHNCILR